MKLAEINYNELNTNKVKCVYFSQSITNKVVAGYKELYRISDITKEDKHDNLYFEIEYSNYNNDIQSIYLYENYNTICMKLNYIRDMELSEFTSMIANYKYFTYDGLKTLLSAKEVNSDFINLAEIEVLKLNNDTELAKHYTNYRTEFYNKKHMEELEAKAEREQLEKEEAEKHKLEIENKLLEAEQKILDKQLLVNDDIEETTLLLMLFKKYNINVPLKTQGWINKALAQISYNQSTNNYTYSYYTTSKDSTVFRSYFDMLISAIKHAYNVVTEEEKAQEESKQNAKQESENYINSIENISFKKCNNTFREQFELRQQLKAGKQKEFTIEEVEMLVKRAYKALKVDNINTSVQNYMMLHKFDRRDDKPCTRLNIGKNNINITIEAIELDDKVIYLFTKTYDNKADTYIYKEVV